MGSLIDKLSKKELINPPSHMKNNVQYEVLMGSIAYGCSNDTSDCDVYGFSIPYKDMIFPHLTGYIDGFGKRPIRFEQFQMHHIKDKEERVEYDVTIYSIIKYFQLCMNNNPNMIDSLFVPRRCILHSTQLAEHVRENRKLFLHRGSWHKFKGYAYSQLNKMRSKVILRFVHECKLLNIDPLTFDIDNSDVPIPYSLAKSYTEMTKGGDISKRLPGIVEYGYDIKFAYHIVRLLNEVQQILIEGDLDLERNREQLKSIRRGEWTKEQIIEYFENKEKTLEDVYLKSTLPYGPDEDRLKRLLLECLEMHFGNLDNAILVDPSLMSYINQLEYVVDNMKRQLDRKYIVRVES